MTDPYARQKAYYRRQHPMAAVPPAERPCQECGGPIQRDSYKAALCRPCLRVHERARSRRYRAAHPEKRREWHRRAYRKRREDPAKVEADRERHRRMRAADPYRVRELHRLWRHGLTAAEYQVMWARQEGACALCLTPFPATADERYARREPQIDHDHGTGEVRGLLCRTCNTRLGAVEKLTPEWWARLRHYIGAGDDWAGAMRAVEEMVG